MRIPSFPPEDIINEREEGMRRSQGEKEGERYLERTEKADGDSRQDSIFASQRFNACTHRCTISCKEQSHMHAIYKMGARKGSEIQ
jgi:hypothetical protein